MPRYRYTHLLPPDAELLAAYLTAHPKRYINVDYDVKVGHGRDPGPAIPDNYRRNAISLSQRRIDAVGTREDRIDIIEVTTQAGLTALGQLSAYPELYRSTFSPRLPVFPILVTYQFDSDMQPLYAFAHIEYYIMPRPTP